MFCTRRFPQLAKGIKTLLHQQNVSRCMSTATDRVLLEKNEQTGVVTMKLNRPPVNSLNLDFLTDITIALEKLENDKSCKGLILTSSNNKVFCAGLDIMEMYQPQTERLTEFWRTLQGVWIALYSSRLPTIAAINGHSPAGGCLLALCCDYRVMAPNCTIGLNETQLGIIPPFWFVDSMQSVCGQRQTELCCQKGLMMMTDQALKIGLIDEVAPVDVMKEKVENEMATWTKIPDFARELTKSQIRKPTVDKLIARREDDINHFVNFITRDSVQKALGYYIQMMKQKQKK